MKFNSCDLSHRHSKIFLFCLDDLLPDIICLEKHNLKKKLLMHNVLGNKGIPWKTDDTGWSHENYICLHHLPPPLLSGNKITWSLTTIVMQPSSKISKRRCKHFSSWSHRPQTHVPLLTILTTPNMDHTKHHQLLSAVPQWWNVSDIWSQRLISVQTTLKQPRNRLGTCGIKQI